MPYATYGFAAQMAEVEVDMALGTVKVLDIVAAHDVGRAINPTLVEGQIHGGIAQGLGLALMEEFIPGRTENLHDYLIPTVGDMPRVKCYPHRGPGAHRPLRRQGRRRAGPDRHRAGHPVRHPPRHAACASPAFPSCRIACGKRCSRRRLGDDLVRIRSRPSPLGEKVSEGPDEGVIPRSPVRPNDLHCAATRHCR